MNTSRVFTLEEANRTLPYIRRVVTDLVHDYREWHDTLAAYELAAARRRAAEDGAPDDGSEALRLERRAGVLARAIEGYLAEITAVGAEVKGFGEGLIDFPGEVEGRQVRWCWMLGEPAVEHWHDPESGFSGRQSTGLLVGAHDDRE